MKKIICLLLVAVMCFATLTGCAQLEGIIGSIPGLEDLLPGQGDGDGTTDDTGIDNALKYLNEMYKDLSGPHAKDFDVVAQVIIAAVKYPVVWTADNDAVTIRESVKTGYYTVDLPDDNAEAIEFTLTATISSPNSSATKQKEFSIKVPGATVGNVLSIPAAIELGSAQENSQYTAEKYYVTGKVDRITQDTYCNMYLVDEDGHEILIYGTYDATGKVRFDAMSTKPVVGDQITVYGVVGNYNGTPQLKNAWITAINGVELGGGENNTNGLVLDMMGSTNVQSYSATKLIYSANGITLTNDKNSSTTDCYNNTSTYAARFYAGSTIKIEYTGMTKIVIIFDDYSPDGSKTYMSGFDGMNIEGATFVRNNDVLTIYFAQATDVFQSAALGSQVRIEQIEVFTGSVETPPSGDSGNSGNSGSYSAPVVGEAYKLFLQQTSLNKTLYFAGSLDAEKGTYLATTEDASAAVEIYFEAATGGYYIYFMNGTDKCYINAAAYLKSNGYAGCHFELGSEPKSVWTYDLQYGILEIYDEIDGQSDTFFAGTYGSYSTISLSGSYYKDQISSGTQFPARIVLANGGSTNPDQGGNGGNSGNDNPGTDNPGQGGTETPDADGVKLTVDSLGLPSQSYNAEASTATVGGISFEFIQLGNYGDGIQMRDKDGKTSTLWNTTAFPSAIVKIVLTYSNTKDVTHANSDAVIFTFGNSVGDAAYTTKLSTEVGVKTYTITPNGDYTFFKLEHDLGYTFYWDSIVFVLADGTTVNPDQGGNENPGQGGTQDPEQGGTDTTEPVEMTIAEALAAAQGTKVIIKGTVSDFYQGWDAGYGNCSPYIQDADGNKIIIFRTTTKVGIGDQITVTGTIGAYNDVNQIAQEGSVVVIDVAHTCSYTEKTCTADSVCKLCGTLAENGKATGHSYVDGACSACGVAQPEAGALPEDIDFVGLANKASADDYLKANHPTWTITGKLGQGYADYLGFGRSGDKASAITSPDFAVSSAFTVTAVIKGNGSSGVMTSTLTFTLVDADGNLVATGYASGSSTAAITPVDAKDTTYDISFTLVDGKTWADVSNLVISFEKTTGNIGLKSLEFNQ